jgi:hypothetical protein
VSKNPVSTQYWLGALTVVFLGLGAVFIVNGAGHPVTAPKIPLVDVKFLDRTASRRTYADLVKAGDDLSDYDCYGCHEKNKPPPIRYDANHRIIVPKEHADIVMGHGSHDRNNLCYNCHNEQNLLTLQVRDGREVGFDNIPQLCGSCHGPNLRDWEAGAHGRTSGYWNRALGAADRLSCANCHNPHAPRIPTREPAPPPHSLHGPAGSVVAHETTP